MKLLRTLFQIVIILLILSSCQGKKAIEIVKKAKVTSQSMLLNFYFNGGTDAELTWESFCNLQAKQTPNIKYSWTSEKTDENGIYVVAFIDENKSGWRWQVDVNNEIVIFINDDEYLSRKYGLHRRDKENNFELTTIKVDTLRVFKKGTHINEIDYKLTCSVINKTGKRLTDADISGKLKVIFKDKTITGESTYYSGFTIPITSYKPWNTNSEREIKITTKSIEGIYLSYEPEFVFFELGLKASDPVGFSFDHDIYEKDLLSEWNKRKESFNIGKLYDFYETTESTNFYTKPSDRSKKIGYLRKGTVVGGVAFVDTRWIKVKTKANEGYVEIKFLKPINVK